MRPWRLVSSVSPMRPSSRAGAPELERTRPLTTFALDVALYGTVASRATRSGWPAHGQDHVAVERRACAAGVKAGDAHVAGQLAMQRRQLVRLDGAGRGRGANLGDHPAGQGPESIPRVEPL